MTAHNLRFCSDRTVTIPGGALVYLTDPEKIESDYPGYTTADDADVEAGDLTLTFTDVTAEDNDDGTVTYTIQLTERADITQRRTQEAPIYGVGARFATVLPFDAATGQVFPSLTEDWTPHRAYTGADDHHRGRPYLRNAHQSRHDLASGECRRATWRPPSRWTTCPVTACRG